MSVAGSWVGTVLLPNAYNATMALQQNGNAVSGTMRIGGVMGETPITGNLDSAARTMSWRVYRSCEEWRGTLTAEGSGQSMTGPLYIDRTGCQPAQSNGDGRLMLDRR
jgi:hypothetical protein